MKILLFKIVLSNSFACQRGELKGRFGMNFSFKLVIMKETSWQHAQ